MTSTRTTSSPRRDLGPGVATAVVAATAPYLALKLAWLAGSTVGVLDPAFLASPGMGPANAATACLDLCAVALALALARAPRPGHRRIPATAVLLTGWVGTGLLTLVVLATPLAALLGLVSGGPTLDGPEPLAGWVHPLVYTGFTVQGVGLTVLLARHLRHRWPAALHPGPTPELARVLVLGAAPLLMVATGREVADALGVGHPATPESVLVALLRAGLLTAAVVGAVLTTRGRGGGAVAAAWLGTGTATAWGLYALLTTLGGTVLADRGDVVGNLADLAQTLGGLVAALAVLGTLVDRVEGSARDLRG